MITKKFWALPMIGILCLMGTATQAASIESAIKQAFGNGPTPLNFEDDVQIGTIDDGGDGTLDFGDRISGHLVFRNISRTSDGKAVTLGSTSATTNVNELTGFVQLQVTSKSGTAASGFTYQFGAWTSGGTITAQSGNANAILAIYEDAAQNGNLGGAPIPDPTLVDGQLWGYLGLGGPGTTDFTVATERFADGVHHDESSAALVPSSELLGHGNIRLNLIDQGGAALTDSSKGVYNFGPNAFGTQFAGSFDFFGGAGTGADYSAQLEVRSNVQIIPLPPAVLAAIPGLLMLGYAHRRRRLA